MTREIWGSWEARLRARLQYRRRMVRRRIRSGGCVYLLEERGRTEHAVYGYLAPRPRIRGTSITFGALLPTEAELEFVLWPDGVGRFNSIHVPIENHRQGVATGMIEALFAAYPDVRWYNSALNEKSGPLFQSIHAKHPTRLYAVLTTPAGKYFTSYHAS